MDAIKKRRFDIDVNDVVPAIRKRLVYGELLEAFLDFGFAENYYDILG